MTAETEKGFRKTIKGLGLTMIVFYILSWVWQITMALMDRIDYSNNTGLTVFYYTVYGAVYMAAFMVPVAFLKLFYGNDRSYDPDFKCSVPKDAFAYIFALILITSIFSLLNTILITPTGIFDFFDDGADIVYTSVSDAEVIMQFMATALVPGICEEFLFRGIVLKNLLPYSKSVAIFGSAILFGLMHQNPTQMLYTTVAGIGLGFIYVETGSIWTSTIAHIMNNAFSVATSALYGKTDSNTADVIAAMIDVVMIIAGVISIAYLAVKYSKRARLAQGGRNPIIKAAGAFGYTATPIMQADENDFDITFVRDENEGAEARGKNEKTYFKLFFTSPVMLFYMCFCVLQMLILVGCSLIYSGGNI